MGLFMKKTEIHLTNNLKSIYKSSFQLQILNLPSDAFYYDRLLQDPLFKTKIREMLETISITDDILQYIDETAVLLDKSQELNFKRWDIMNIRVSVGGTPMGSYKKEVECDRQFFINHINWLNSEISNY